MLFSPPVLSAVKTATIVTALSAPVGIIAFLGRAVTECMVISAVVPEKEHGPRAARKHDPGHEGCAVTEGIL